MIEVIYFIKKNKKINKKINIFNPYFIFSFIYLGVLFIYQLNWSQLTIPITSQLLLFLIVNIILFGFLGYIFDKNKIMNPLKNYQYKMVYTYISVFIVLGTLLEGIVLKGYPLFNPLGWGNIKYIDYGISIFHVLLLTVSYFFFIVLFECVIHNFKEKKLYFSMFIALFPFFLTINRGMLVMIVISCICLYAQYNKIPFIRKTVILSVFSLLIFFYLFGLFGNYRINSDYKQKRDITDATIIMNVGEATEKFRGNFVPKSFFWTYTYITSPLSNLQYNINEHQKKGNLENDNFFDFMKITFLPETISRRMHPTEINNYRIREELNVGTAFYEVYPRFGWTGMYIYLIVISIFPFIYLSLLNKFASEYINIGISLVCTIYSLLFFTNFLSYTGLMFQLVFPFILNFQKKYNIGSRFLKLVRK